MADLLISQDGHRIVVFDKAGVNGLQLPKALSPTLHALLGTELTRFSDAESHRAGTYPIPITTNDFLHQHFLLCLKLHFVGGDVEETYTSDMVNEVLEVLKQREETGEAIAIEIPEKSTEEAKENWRLLEQFCLDTFYNSGENN